MTLTGRDRSIRNKTCLTHTLSTTNPTLTGLGSNTGLHSNIWQGSTHSGWPICSLISLLFKMDLFPVAPINHKIQVAFHTGQSVIWLGDHGQFPKCCKWKKNAISCSHPSYLPFRVLAYLFLADSITFPLSRPIICDVELWKQIQSSALTMGFSPQSAV